LSRALHSTRLLVWSSCAVFLSGRYAADVRNYPKYHYILLFASKEDKTKEL
jgi:hypothetical protein